MSKMSEKAIEKMNQEVEPVPTPTRKKKALDRIHDIGEVASFEMVGDKFEGLLTNVKRNFPTKFGDMNVLVFRTPKGRESIFCSAGLNDYVWEDVLGQDVEIVYVEDRMSQKTNKEYKAFEVNVYE